MKYISCNFCGNKEYKLFKEVNGYKLVKCNQCGLVYLNFVQTQPEINKKYSAKYLIELQKLKTKEAIKKEINKNTARVEEILKQFGEKRKLLDIGCGTGFFIARLKQYGWKVTGIELSKWASKFAKERLGLNVLQEPIEDIELNEHFDVITMYHVLEHLSDPLGTLKKVSTILADNGVLIIKGPNLISFDRIYHGKNWRGYNLPFHLYHFTPKTYRMCLEKAGFSIQKMTFQYWNPFTHLLEIMLGDGMRADRPSDTFERFYKSKAYNLIFKKIRISKILYIIAKFLSLKDRDLTIYAKKS